MRGLVVTAVLAAWLLPPVPARAGLYSTREHLLHYVFGPPADFKNELDNLQSIVAKVTEKSPGSPRRQVLAQVETLEQKRRDGNLIYEDRINLSACYVRLQQPETIDKAIRLLEELPRGERDFVALSNLATAYQLAGNLQRAESYLTDALESWPHVSTWIPDNPWRLNWLRMAEKAQLQIIRSRAREQREARGAPASLDAIFPGLRWVGPSGEYEPGLLAADQWAKVPAYSLFIVKQLVLWMPHDLRLRWLLAELANAEGDSLGAVKLMDDMSLNYNYGNPEFREHHAVLRRARAVADHLNRMRSRFLEEKATAALVPLSALMPPGAAVTLEAGGTVVALDKIVKEPLPDSEPSTAAETDSPPPAAPPPAAWTPEWRQIGVSFVAG
ncbi:MAG TPA: tetratricopeptide repeat protein, partial [Gemmataceae bacterium]|nr:tetratricopeptide repeat protein [Gemmataceae bacterium]